MKSLKSSWKICLAALAGFLLGIWSSYSFTVQAQSKTPYVGRVPLETTVPGTAQVVGFSCIQNRDVPVTIFGLGTDEPYGETRWRF